MTTKSKEISKADVAALIKDGMSIMVGGFMTNGTPETLVDIIVESGAKDLTLICNDGGFPEKGIGKLIKSRQCKKLITTHVGLNPNVAAQSNAGELKLELVPMGTMVERVRCAGAGLGGVLTPTGVGTVVQEGKQVLEVDGQEYLLELPLKADMAIIKAYKADEIGNVRYKGSTRNFNTVMAMAADVTIAESEELLPAGDIGPEYVETPGIFVNYVMKGAKQTL